MSQYLCSAKRTALEAKLDKQCAQKKAIQKAIDATRQEIFAEKKRLGAALRKATREDLCEIARLHDQGLKPKAISEALGIRYTVITYRIQALKWFRSAPLDSDRSKRWIERYGSWWVPQ